MDIRGFSEHEETVREDWIDYNGHMNVGYYLLPFENASTAFCRHIDISEAYKERSGHAIFAAEAHLTFEREVTLGDRLTFTTRLLGFGEKWINIIHFMEAADAGYLAATNQLIFVHVNSATHKSAPFPKAQQAALAGMLAMHEAYPVPPQAGRAISAGMA
jgi:acyl-CoA thioester hydrolase